jgi:hypothetical protein
MDFHTDEFYRAAPSYVFDYNFITKNFDNACVITVYLWMDYKDDDRFHNMKICERLVLLKMAIKYTIKLYKSKPRRRKDILCNIYKATENYIYHYRFYKADKSCNESDDESDNESDNEKLEEMLDILDSDIFKFIKIE